MVERATKAGNCYGLILMDFLMPGMDGAWATARLRAAGHLASKLPIIGLTALDSRDERVRFQMAGGQACLLKPITRADLSGAFATWLPSPVSVSQPRHVPANWAMRERYFARKAAVLNRINTAIQLSDAAEATIADIQTMVHNLAGTAGYFGEAWLSEAAIACETNLATARGNERLSVLRDFARNVAALALDMKHENRI